MPLMFPTEHLPFPVGKRPLPARQQPFPVPARPHPAETHPAALPLPEAIRKRLEQCPVSSRKSRKAKLRWNVKNKSLFDHLIRKVKDGSASLHCLYSLLSQALLHCLYSLLSQALLHCLYSLLSQALLHCLYSLISLAFLHCLHSFNVHRFLHCLYSLLPQALLHCLYAVQLNFTGFFTPSSLISQVFITLSVTQEKASCKYCRAAEKSYIRTPKSIIQWDCSCTVGVTHS